MAEKVCGRRDRVENDSTLFYLGYIDGGAIYKVRK